VELPSTRKYSGTPEKIGVSAVVAVGVEVPTLMKQFVDEITLITIVSVARAFVVAALVPEIATVCVVPGLKHWIA